MAKEQPATHYIRMVLTQPDGYLRAEAETERSPTVNDLATLLAQAMKRPLVEGHLRPRPSFGFKVRALGYGGLDF
jgi:hypothetical protein